MRVLLFSTVFPPQIGGMERFAEELAAWLHGHGHSVTVATWTADQESGDRARPYRVLRRPGWRELATAIRTAELVHVNGLALRGMVPAVSLRRPLVVTHTSHQAICPTGLGWTPGAACGAGGRPGPCAVCPEQGWRGRAKVVAHRGGAGRASHNVLVSQYLRRRLMLPRARVIYNPLARNAFAAPAPGAGTPGLIGFAGRLVAEKGLDHLLRALAACPQARLEVAGDGPQRGACEALTRELDLSGRVRFLGALEPAAVAEMYARAAVVCVPSLWDEPFGYSAAEAMAMQRPVVATPSGALTELLAGGRGYLAADLSVSALAAALVRALEDEAGCTAAAACARDFAATALDIDVIGADYVATYAEALSGPAPPPAPEAATRPEGRRPS